MREKLLRYSAVAAPCVSLCVYSIYIAVALRDKNGSISFMWDSKGYNDMCTLVTQFASIIISVFGFVVPMVLSRKNNYTDFFWEHINRTNFAKDINTLFTSGIITIILSIILTISDIMQIYFVIILNGLLVAALSVFITDSLRFLGLFVNLLFENRFGEIADPDIAHQMPENDVEKLKQDLNKRK